MIQVQAHRGASAYAPENTLPAFQLALDMRADGFETDVHLTADKQYAVCHDDNIGRTSTGAGHIQDMTMAELKTFDFGVKFDSKFAGTPIPTLDELLELTHHMDVVNIELKGPLAAGQELDEALHLLYTNIAKFGCVERTIVSTFWHDWGRRLKELHPDLRLGLLYGEHYTVEETLALVERCHADAIHPELSGLTPAIVAACRERGVLVNVWTVDAPEAIERAIALEVDGIITNVPDRVLAALGR